MSPKITKPKTISEYIRSSPVASQEKLKEILNCIRSSAPKAKEGIKWGMPAFSHERILVMFAGYDKHIGLYPTPPALRFFSKDIAKYKHAKGSIQFPLNRPLPLSLIRKITKFRVKESLKEDKKWRS